MNTREKIDYIVDWLKTYLDGSSCKGFVVGVSGGIDSATVATLCAMTGKPTLLVQIPHRSHGGSSRDQFDRAERQIMTLKHEWSNVTSFATSLNGLWEQFWNNMEHSPRTIEDNRLVNANSKARLRMTILYHIAGLNQSLVVGTGNKVEDFGVGFFTKYGDGGVDLSPIGDLYKSDVYEIAKELGVSQDIIDAVPTDGLWDDNRSDESQLGATYDELEWVMKNCPEIINHGYNPGRTWKEMTDRQYEVMRLFVEHRNKNKHKMYPIPVCRFPQPTSERWI